MGQSVSVSVSVWVRVRVGELSAEVRVIKRRNVVAALLAAFFVTACLPKVEQPDVWLGGVRLASLGLNGGVLDVRLSVFNPNRFDLEAEGLTYDLSLREADGEWVQFTDGFVDERMRVGAGDTADVVVPVSFSFSGLGQVARALLNSGAVDYRVSGAIALDGPIRREIPYRHEGTVTPGGVRD